MGNTRDFQAGSAKLVPPKREISGMSPSLKHLSIRYLLPWSTAPFTYTLLRFLLGLGALDKARYWDVDNPILLAVYLLCLIDVSDIWSRRQLDCFMSDVGTLRAQTATDEHSWRVTCLEREVTTVPSWIDLRQMLETCVLVLEIYTFVSVWLFIVCMALFSETSSSFFRIW